MRMGSVIMRVYLVLVRMTFLSCAAEQTPYFVRRQVRDNFHTRLKLIRDSFDVMGFHDAEHDFLIYGKGDVHAGSFNHGRPMLVTDGMP